MCSDRWYANEPPRSRLGYAVLFYLPALFVCGVVYCIAPRAAGAHPVWGLAGLKMMLASAYLYGPAEKYCYRVVMKASVIRLIVPAVVIGATGRTSVAIWALPLPTRMDDVAGMDTTTILLVGWATVELAFAGAALLPALRETLPEDMRQQLARRTALGGLSENVPLPRHTRAVLCLVAAVEGVFGAVCVWYPSGAQWLVAYGDGDTAGAGGAMVAFGLTGVVAGAVVAVSVGATSFAPMKWWVATYHICIGSSPVLLRYLFLVPFSTTFTLAMLHLAFGVALALLPSRSGSTPFADAVNDAADAVNTTSKVATEVLFHDAKLRDIPAIMRKTKKERKEKGS